MNKNQNQSVSSEDQWSRYQKLVLSELEKIDNWQESVNKTLTEIKIEVATLKVKAALWGSMAAIILTALLNFGLNEFKPTFDKDQLTRVEKLLEQTHQRVNE